MLRGHFFIKGETRSGRKAGGKGGGKGVSLREGPRRKQGKGGMGGKG